MFLRFWILVQLDLPLIHVWFLFQNLLLTSR